MHLFAFATQELTLCGTVDLEERETVQSGASSSYLDALRSEPLVLG